MFKIKDKVKWLIAVVIVSGILLNSSNVFAFTFSCGLEGKKHNDSDFYGTIYRDKPVATLTLTCSKVSSACAKSYNGTMAVIRGRSKYDLADTEWLMYPALKCKITQKTLNKKYDIQQYATSHGFSNRTNYISVRIYGNHCDNQMTGCYGTATVNN